eukprot:7329076-Ditylum_brightwellii.AAC.1
MPRQPSRCDQSFQLTNVDSCMYKEKCNKSHNVDRHTFCSQKQPIKWNSSVLSIYQHTQPVRQSN